MSVSVGERMVAAGRRHSGTVDRYIDEHLSENMPDLIDRFKLANKNDFLDVERRISSSESELDDLKKWKDETNATLKTLGDKISDLEKKYGTA